MWDAVFQKNMTGIKSTYTQFISRQKIRLQMVCFVTQYKILPRRSLLSKWHMASKYTHTSNVIYAYYKVRPPVRRFSRTSQRLHSNTRRSLISKFTKIGHYMWKVETQIHLRPLASAAFTAAIFTKLTITPPIFANTNTNFLFKSAACIKYGQNFINALKYSMPLTELVFKKLTTAQGRVGIR